MLLGAGLRGRPPPAQGSLAVGRRGEGTHPLWEGLWEGLGSALAPALWQVPSPNVGNLSPTPGPGLTCP